jgi:hypothetical protein
MVNFVNFILINTLLNIIFQSIMDLFPKCLKKNLYVFTFHGIFKNYIDIIWSDFITGSMLVFIIHQWGFWKNLFANFK